MKKLKKVVTFSLLIGLSLNLAAQKNVPVRLSMDRACRLAVDSNLHIINARIEIQKNHFQELEAKSKLYPSLNGYSDFNYYYAIPKMMMPGEMFGQTGEISMEIGTKFDWSSGLKASVPLVNLSNLSAIKLAKGVQNMSRLTLVQKKEEILYQVHQAYYLCQSTSTQIMYLNKNMENTNRLLEILDSQNKNGIVRKIDYSKLTVAKNNLQTQIDNLQKLESQQCNMLKFIIGLNNDCELELTDSLGVHDIQSYIEPDLVNHTDIVLIDSQIEISQLNKQSASRMYLPELCASGQFYYQGQQNKFNYFQGKDKFFKVGFVGLSLNIPILDGFEKQNKIRQYKSEITQLQNTKRNTLNGLWKDYANAREEYCNGLKTINRQRENIKVAEDNYNISFQQYKQQTLLLSDLILAENSLTEARLSYVDALLQLKNAELELVKLNGGLVK
jgi:outer membrane protein TolC